MSFFAQVSHARVSSLENQMEGLVRSEILLKEKVSTLELERDQLGETVARLRQILTSLNIDSSPDGHTLPMPSERDAVTAEVTGAESRQWNLISSLWLSHLPRDYIWGSSRWSTRDFYPLPIMEEDFLDNAALEQIRHTSPNWSTVLLNNFITEMLFAP